MIAVYFLAWVATMISVLLLTIGSCAGYLATPLQSQKWFPYLMLFMISLAVAVLTGDAMLHLFPHVSTYEIIQFEPTDFESTELLNKASLAECINLSVKTMITRKFIKTQNQISDFYCNKYFSEATSLNFAEFKSICSPVVLPYFTELLT